MAFVYPPTALTDRTVVVEVETGPQSNFLINNATPYHLFLRAGRRVDPAAFEPDDMVLPWQAKAAQLDMGDVYYISYYADPAYASSDAANPQGLAPTISIVADQQVGSTVVPASVPRGLQVVSSENWSFTGSLWNAVRAPSIFTTIRALSLVAATDTVIWTPTAGKSYRFMGYVLYVGTSTDIQFKDGVGGPPIFATEHIGGVNPVPVSLGDYGIKGGAVARPLVIRVGFATGMWGTVWGVEE